MPRDNGVAYMFFTGNANRLLQKRDRTTNEEHRGGRERDTREAGRRQGTQRATRRGRGGTGEERDGSPLTWSHLMFVGQPTLRTHVHGIPAMACAA